MDETANLSLAYIAPQQAQKFITHNEALRDLDTLVQLSVLDRDLATPPGSPSAGDRYLVATSPTGAWSGQAGRIAAWQDGGWLFYDPRAGWRAWVADEAALLVFDGTGWAPATPVNPAPMLGVLTTADATNRLAVKSDAALFANDDVTPGSGDMRIVVSKAAAARTASLTYQDDFSGRAEMGLTGDDAFHVKVSPDGSTWYEGLTVGGTGGVEFPSIATTAGAANAVLDSASNNALLRSTSSLRFKTAIEPVDPARSHALLAAEPIWYRSTAPADEPGWSYYGFGAEPVAAIDPRMVQWGFGESDYEKVTTAGGRTERRLRPNARKTPQAVAYDRFVVHHHVLLNELFRRVEALEARETK